MKTNIRTQALLLGATIIGTILFTGVTVPAATIFQTVTNGAGTDWTLPIWGGPPAAVANSANDYVTTNTLIVRTPNKNLSGLYSTNFAGNSLRIDTNGIFYLKHGGNVTNAAVVNLILNGGVMTYHGGFGGVPAPVGGTIKVTLDSTINSDQTSPNNVDIWLLSPISGNGNLTVFMDNQPNGVVLFGNNAAYTGTWTNTQGFLSVQGGTTNAFGSGGILLNGSGTSSLVFNSTNNLVVNNSISGAGFITKLNTNRVTLGGNNTFTGSLRITNGVIQLGAGSSLTNSSEITLANGSTLDASLVGGLTLGTPTSQILDCNGTVIGNLTASAVNTLNFSINSLTNDILNVNGSLTLSGNPTLNVTQTGFKPSGTYRLINYTGTIQGGGSFNFVPPVGSSETFALDTTTPGQVNLVVTGTTLNLTWVGDGSANNWDTSSANWIGGATVYAAGDNVTFNDSGSSSPDINIVNSSLFPSSMTVNNTSEKYIFDGSASSVGIVTLGPLVKMGTNELDFTSSGNNFMGPVTIQSGTLSIGNGASFGSLGTPSSITNNGVLQVNTVGGGATFKTPITGSGSINVMGGNSANITSVTLSSTNSYTGGTTVGADCQLVTLTPTGLGSGSATVLAGGTLRVNALVGSMTVTNPLVISGDYVTPGGALYVNTTGNNVTWAGPVTIGTGNDGNVNQIRAANVNVNENFSNTVLGTNELLECTSGNTTNDVTTVMTFSNTISLGSGGSLLVDGFAVVVLAGNTNVWGGGTIVGLTGNSSFITYGTAILLVNGKLNGGTLSVSNLCTLGGSGTILDPVTVDGSLAPGNFGIGTLTVSNSVTLDSGSTNVMELNRASSPNSDRLVASSITFGGTLIVTNAGAVLQAGDTFQLFSSSSISGAFAVTNLPTLSLPNLYWDTSLLSSGTIKVASTAAAPFTNSPPYISGTNLIFQTGPSTSGFNYVLQATPSLAPTTWTNIYTNAGTGGMLNFTNPITPGTPQQFFRITAQ